MNYATKLCIVSMMSVFSVSSIGLVQAADTPIVSTGGVAYNIGVSGNSKFTYSDNVTLGGDAGTTNGNPYQNSNDLNAKGNNIAIGRISLNGSSGGANVALGSKTFLMVRAIIISSVILPLDLIRLYPIRLPSVPSLVLVRLVIKTYGLAQAKPEAVLVTIRC